jgi:hypothetical protein
MMRSALMLALALIATGCATSQVDDSAASGAAAHNDRMIVVTVRNPDGPVPARAGSTVRDYNVQVGYSASPAARAAARAIAAQHRLREVSAWPIGLLSVHCMVFEIPTGIDRDETLERLRRDRRVESAQPLHSFDTLNSVAPDPYRNLQRNLDTMSVAQAHRWSRGEGVRIAIIDTGVDAQHPDLAGRIAAQRNFVDGSAVASERHGTAVAGVIGAVENNDHGIVGIAPQAKLYAFKACWPDASNGSRGVCNTLTLARALSAAIEARADIVNLSLTGPADPLLSRLIDLGIERGLTFVGAVPPANAAVSFPTNISGVISVDASGNKGFDGDFLLAPGTDVLTLAPQGRYDFMSGSSLAAASVSGGIALLLARDRKLRSPDARAILAKTSNSGLASVDFCAALTVLLRAGSCSETQAKLLPRSFPSSQPSP